MVVYVIDSAPVDVLEFDATALEVEEFQVQLPLSAGL